MNQETSNYIMQRMSKYLDNSQMIKLKHTLDESLMQSEDGRPQKGSQELLDITVPDPQGVAVSILRIIQRNFLKRR
ncbi:MAG: hypothetical protein E7301_12445 [Butyrivibrio sp.]|nr:hypothetical protein [Butyrivibrio sp.]